MIKHSIILSLSLCAICASLFFACSSESSIGESEPVDSGIDHAYCVFPREQMCLPGPVSICPKGGILSDTCPEDEGYTDMTVQNSSSSLEASSSSKALYIENTDMGIFANDTTFIDPRDEKEYKYIISNGKAWMTDNLNYSRDGTLGLCLIDCDKGNGLVYKYDVAIDENPLQGLCPKGWKIPTYAEWASVPLAAMPAAFYRQGRYWTSTANADVVIIDAVNSIKINSNGTINDRFAIRCIANDSLPCGTENYAIATDFCFDNDIYERCGDKMYNLEKSFCSGAKLYALCGGLTYVPATEGCLSETVFKKCKDILYNDGTHFCVDNDKLYKLCDGKIYDPEEEGCFEGKTWPLCDGHLYDTEYEFCAHDDKLYELCDGIEYFPVEHGCHEDMLLKRCGIYLYDEETEFCVADKDVYDKCGGEIYDPATKGCSEDKILTRCGFYLYDESVSFCVSNNVYDKCGGLIYEPAIQKCEAGVLFILNEDFEDNTHSFTLVNGTITNKWFIGTATSYSGFKSAYISNNGSENSYTMTSPSVVHLYKDIIFPTSSKNFVMKYNFKGMGETNNDYMTLRYGNTTSTPSASVGTSRSVTVAMRDSYGDGWNNCALRININGTNLASNATFSSGSSSSATFSVNPGDVVQVYWVLGYDHDETAFAIYYTDDPPIPAFNPALGATNDTQRILLSKQYTTFNAPEPADGTLLGSFTVPVSSAIFTGTLIDSVQGYSDWTERTVILPASDFNGKTMRMVFSWINNASGGTQPPAAIDNITISVVE
ncbi:MAG: hypothetical protein FWB90_03105 [Fibromonadales bacterium]|nr:hypothetical protein [Fibromonadales bacterium]